MKNDACPGIFPWQEISDVEGFCEAWQRLRGALEVYDATGLSTEAVVAALFTGMLPRLMVLYGPEGVPDAFRRVADAVSHGVRAAKLVQ